MTIEEIVKFLKFSSLAAGVGNTATESRITRAQGDQGQNVCYWIQGVINMVDRCLSPITEGSELWDTMNGDFHRVPCFILTQSKNGVWTD